MNRKSFNVTRGYLESCTVLDEVDDHNPTDEEIRMYAKDIGIDPDNEPELLHIAREGVSASVPKGWLVLQDRDGAIFYQQKCSGICIWEHPLDAQFRLRVVEARAKLLSNKDDKPVGENQIGSEPTPVKTETIYHPLPLPRVSVSQASNKFKIPTVPQKTVSVSTNDQHSSGMDSSSSVSLHSPYRVNFPRLNSSPTGSPQLRTVLSENTVSAINKSDRECHYDTNENVDPVAVDNLADKFTYSACISAPVLVGKEQHRKLSDKHGLFAEPDDDVASCLFSPPTSPKLHRRVRRHDHSYHSPRTPFKSGISNLDDVTGTGLNGSTNIEDLLEEQKRLQEKIAFLKVTYKVYKLRLATVNSRIKTLSTSPMAVGSGATGTNDGGSGVVTSSADQGFTTMSSVNAAPQKTSTFNRRRGVNASRSLHRPNHQGGYRQKTYSNQSAVSGKTPRSNL